MSFRTTAAIFVSLGAGQFISCWANNPSRSDDEDGYKIVAGPTVTVAAGNVYTSVVIGSQVGRVENWRSTKNNDSTEIPHVADNAVWAERNPVFAITTTQPIGKGAYYRHLTNDREGLIRQHLGNEVFTGVLSSGQDVTAAFAWRRPCGKATAASER